MKNRMIMSRLRDLGDRLTRLRLPLGAGGALLLAALLALHNVSAGPLGNLHDIGGWSNRALFIIMSAAVHGAVLMGCAVHRAAHQHSAMHGRAHDDEQRAVAPAADIMQIAKRPGADVVQRQQRRQQQRAPRAKRQTKAREPVAQVPQPAHDHPVLHIRRLPSAPRGYRACAPADRARSSPARRASSAPASACQSDAAASGPARSTSATRRRPAAA